MVRNKHSSEAAYLAGIIDGEGCFKLQRSGGGQSHAYISPYVVVVMNDKTTIEHLHQLWGGNFRRVKQSNPRYRDGYLWSVSSQEAVNLIAMVWPFLKAKRTQAWIVFQFWADRTKRGGKRISPEESALREGYKLALHQANARGNLLPE